MNESAIIYCENEFGKIDGKVANGLVRHSLKYHIVGIIDSTKAGMDAGAYLDGTNKRIPIFSSLDDALEQLDHVPECFIYGIAPLASFLDKGEREILFAAMELNMNIVNGLPEFLTEDKEFIEKAATFGVDIQDVRKPKHRKDLHIFSGRIHEVLAPVLAVLGTDCAVGKRTTAITLVEALMEERLGVAFVATGQTGLLQGAKYGVAVDVLSSGFASGEVENAIIEAYEEEHPDIIVVEGQGSLGHPAFTSSSSIIRGSMPNAVVVQHPPKRQYHCDYPKIPMPSLESEIELIELFSPTKVIAITINHEDMTDDDVISTISEYEDRYGLPTDDVLKYGCNKLIKVLYDVFPALKREYH